VAEVAVQRAVMAAGCSVPQISDEWFVVDATNGANANGLEQGEHWLVMEKLAGVFVKVVGTAPTVRTRVKTWGRELIAAIQCMHTAGYIHHDLKLGNVMLTLDLAHLKVMDFGFARSAARPIYDLTGHNTGLYRDENNGLLDRVEDYAIGLTIFELGTGVSIADFVQQHRNNNLANRWDGNLGGDGIRAWITARLAAGQMATAMKNWAGVYNYHGNNNGFGDCLRGVIVKLLKHEITLTAASVAINAC